MKLKLLLTLTIFIFISPINKIPVYANYAPIQHSSGGAVIFTKSNISIKEEKLYIKINEDQNSQAEIRDGIEISVDYIFYNPSETQILEIGFPISGQSTNFQVKQDGSEIPFVYKEYKQAEQIMDYGMMNILPVSHYISIVEFKKGETRLSVKYNTKISSYEAREYRGSVGNVNYILNSAQNWNGPIGDLQITVDFNSPTSPARFSTSSPQYNFRQIDQNRIYFRAKNIIPYTNLKISFIYDRYWREYMKYVSVIDDFSISNEQRESYVVNLKNFGVTSANVYIDEYFPPFVHPQELRKYHLNILVEDLLTRNESIIQEYYTKILIYAKEGKCPGSYPLSGRYSSANREIPKEMWLQQSRLYLTPYNLHEKLLAEYEAHECRVPISLPVNITYTSPVTQTPDKNEPQQLIYTQYILTPIYNVEVGILIFVLTSFAWIFSIILQYKWKVFSKMFAKLWRFGSRVKSWIGSKIKRKKD
jgi:hypothetical protein